ncbi:hypothetical protein AVEN_39878-1 [Araneus ventricosus]|uniref:Uncharacterized protein n=1 Tax=Araneus ventricosus TaxID=182803 RepID=A0A4Y2KTE1_ARAVE|nr:hypothetical protein AVEN_39878-1 [Araneus ventricosus]
MDIGGNPVYFTTKCGVRKQAASNPFYQTVRTDRSIPPSFSRCCPIYHDEMDFLWKQIKIVAYEWPIESPEEPVSRISVAAADGNEMAGIFQHIRDSLRSQCIAASGRSFEYLL